MSTFRLPYDVLDNVFLYLDGRSLVSACLVNKFFNIPASRALYGREINLDPWKSKWSISPKYASMIRSVVWREKAFPWDSALRPTHLVTAIPPNAPRLRAFRWVGASTINTGLGIKLFVELTKMETLQEITLPTQRWSDISISDEWKEALDRSRVVQLGGLSLYLLGHLSARVLQRLTSIKEPVASLRDAHNQNLLLVTHLRDLVFEPHYHVLDYAKVLEIIGKLRNLQTLRLALRFWTSGGDITPFDASLPHLRYFTLAARRQPGTSTKSAAYIVKTLTADAALETLDLRCDFKGWDTATIYRAIKRHSKTLRVLCAPGWYADTAMLQALDRFLTLEEVTIGRIVHLKVDVLRGFKRIQRVYLYNHQHAPPLPTSEVKILLLQGNSTIQTLGVSGYTDKHGRTIDIWRAHWTYDAILGRPRRHVVWCTQQAIEGMVAL